MLDINNDQNLLDNTKDKKELSEIVDFRGSINDNDKLTNKEDEESPKEVKDNIITNDNSENPENPEKPEVTMEKPHEKEVENSMNEEKKQSYIDETASEGAAHIGKKEMESLLLILNSYWIELLGSISLIIYLVIILFLAFMVLKTLNSLFGDDEVETFAGNAMSLIDMAINKLGVKWLFFINMSQHLSVGFFCLSTFTAIMRETKNIKKFYIVNFIKIAIYYGVSVVILKVILGDKLRNYFNDVLSKHAPGNKKLSQFFDNLVNKILNMVGGFLATFNTFLEKFTFGSMYIFLFEKPKCCMGKKMIYFRLLALIPVIYTIASLVLRGLHNSGTFEISPYILPALLGPKITVYVFFISTISIIKLKSLKYEVFDEENEILPKVFTKIGSRNFGIMGILELIVGLFVPSFSAYGIGGKYLLVLCAPIMTLYDYKKKYVLKFPCCKKGNMSLCFKICFLIIGWAIVIAIGIADFFQFIVIFGDFIEIIIKLLIKYFDTIVDILDLFI